MSQKSRGRREARLSFAVDADSLFSESGHKNERKERQLCRQVQEAVAEALASFDDETLNESWVAGVEPAPDASRLLVLVQIPRGASADVAREHLARATGSIRSEVAHAITRKRVPVLVFQVFSAEDQE